MKPELKREIRGRIPGVAFSVIIGVVTTLLMKPWGFSYLEVFTVSLCVLLILDPPFKDIVRKVTEHRSKRDH